MTPTTSRFAAWQRLPARLLLAALIALCGYGMAISMQPQGGAREAEAVDLSRTDLALYQAIADRVSGGENYYSAVTSEQRARNYPLRPVVTVRLPTLAWTIGLLGPDGASLLLRALVLGALAALTVRLRSLAGSKATWAGATALAAGSLVLLTVPAMTYWHESWAALLIAASLACRTKERWAASLALGLAAALFRELAFPYLLVMAFAALRERRRSEAVAWGAASLVFLAALAAHAATLSSYIHATDPASPGWASAGGWPFILDLVQHCTLFALLPLPLTAAALPVALVGWASLCRGTMDRAALLLTFYLVAFMLIGRADNFYWGLLIAPLLPIGLAFAPAALRDLVRSAGRRGSPDAPAAATA
jgi:hypothetical protein